MLQDFNKDIKARDELIFGKYDESKYIGGCRNFSGLTIEKMEQLIADKYLDPSERQNKSPTVAEFLRFMKKYEGYHALGYVVSVRREDYRTSIEGIYKVGSVNAEETADFEEYRGILVSGITENVMFENVTVEDPEEMTLFSGFQSMSGTAGSRETALKQ